MIEHYLQTLKQKDCDPRILYPTNLLFEYEVTDFQISKGPINI